MYYCILYGQIGRVAPARRLDLGEGVCTKYSNTIPLYPDATSSCSNACRLA